jgi:L-ascorbate metabolism protein UlaG (beta-lactamase superfamily)
MGSWLTWHGHANFQIHTADNVSILIDPWFEGNPSAPGSHQEAGRVDLVLVTHDHGDHTGQAVEICRATGAMVLANVETAGRLQELGIPGEQVVNGIGINIGGTVEVMGIRATMVQAFHSSATGSAVGYIVTLPDGYRLYHAGDTGLFSTMELWGRLYPMDLAMLPIGGVFTMDPAQAAMACSLLRCRRVVPMHWGTFPVLEQNLERFRKELADRSPETELVAMRPGERIELEA